MSTLHELRPHCVWDSIEAIVADLVPPCLLCLEEKAGELKPRPLRELIHGAWVGEAIQFDVLRNWAGRALSKRSTAVARKNAIVMVHDGTGDR